MLEEVEGLKNLEIKGTVKNMSGTKRNSVR